MTILPLLAAVALGLAIRPRLDAIAHRLARRRRQRPVHVVDVAAQRAYLRMRRDLRRSRGGGV